jgi:hypothetical protein
MAHRAQVERRRRIGPDARCVYCGARIWLYSARRVTFKLGPVCRAHRDLPELDAGYPVVKERL